jgi:predicted Zn-dependent protease
VTTPRAGRRVRRLIVLLIAVSLLGLAAPPAWAWYHLRAGRADLNRYHPEEARDHLAAAQSFWPGRPGVHLLAARAARQAGDFTAADGHLRSAYRAAGGPTAEGAFEWALLQAAAGNVGEVDQYLQEQAGEDPARAALVWEAVAEGYLRVYRTLDAMATLDHWLKIEPDNVRALELRGMTFVTGKGVTRGTEDFRRVLELDPSRDQTRWRLAQCLIDLGGYEEALPHLEQLARERPDDPDVLARLARCQNMLNRGPEARQLLDGVLTRHPDNAAALRTRGQFALADRDPAAAEQWLRQAVAAAPSDYQTHWLLFQALQQSGQTEAAKAQLKVAEGVKDQIERLGELQSRKLAERPLDPALHYEMGVLFLRTGYPAEGEAWLKSALELDPNYAPAHAALAEHRKASGAP